MPHCILCPRCCTMHSPPSPFNPPPCTSSLTPSDDSTIKNSNCVKGSSSPTPRGVESLERSNILQSTTASSPVLAPPPSRAFLSSRLESYPIITPAEQRAQALLSALPAQMSFHRIISA